MSKQRNAHRFGAIIWDWNGTLLDDAQCAMDCMNQLLANRSMPLMDRTRYRSIFGFPIEDYYVRAGFDRDHEPFSILSKEFIAQYYSRIAEPVLFPGARELLLNLKAAGVAQYILSAMEQKPLERQTAANGVLDLMDTVQGLDNIHARSKAAEGRILVKQIDLPARKILFIGDTRHDLEVGLALNLPVILVNHGHQELSSGVDGALAVCGDLDDLRELLAGFVPASGEK